MGDLIDKQTVIDALYDWREHSMTDAEAWHLKQVIFDIKCMPSLELPSAEPEERTAKVEVVEKPNVFKCSECGQYFHRTAWGSPVEYCSRCGARLEWE